MATTLVALHVAGNIATIGHVGDSRLYRVDGNGSLFRETQDHSIVEEEVRAGRMTAEQAANHPSRNVISRALGAEPTVEIDMKTIMFEPNTAFLLCSDGITRHINDFEIRELLIDGDLAGGYLRPYEAYLLRARRRGQSDRRDCQSRRSRRAQSSNGHGKSDFEERDDCRRASGRRINCALFAGDGRR